jgi:hydrogenase maturation factor HypF (carbamoyltransferase family)
MASMQICLKCARQEYRTHLVECCICGGALWFPQNVGGKPGNTNIDEAIKLIQKGKRPWEKG